VHEVEGEHCELVLSAGAEGSPHASATEWNAMTLGKLDDVGNVTATFRGQTR